VFTRLTACLSSLSNLRVALWYDRTTDSKSDSSGPENVVLGTRLTVHNAMRESVARDANRRRNVDWVAPKSLHLIPDGMSWADWRLKNHRSLILDRTEKRIGEKSADAKWTLRQGAEKFSFVKHIEFHDFATINC
jgi:hypothetical protein